VAGHALEKAKGSHMLWERHLGLGKGWFRCRYSWTDAKTSWEMREKRMLWDGDSEEIPKCHLLKYRFYKSRRLWKRPSLTHAKRENVHFSLENLVGCMAWNIDFSFEILTWKSSFFTLKYWSEKSISHIDFWAFKIKILILINMRCSGCW
jgi:hypothetical protein